MIRPCVWIRENAKYPVLSIDDYFTDPNTGSYHFEFDKNHLAYKQCERLTREHMQAQTQKIFLDNTFTLEWEMEPYFKLASEFNYKVFVLTVENRHGGKNSHAITNEQVQKMAEKYKVVLL